MDLDKMSTCVAFQSKMLMPMKREPLIGWWMATASMVWSNQRNKPSTVNYREAELHAKIFGQETKHVSSTISVVFKEGQ